MARAVTRRFGNPFAGVQYPPVVTVALAFLLFRDLAATARVDVSAMIDSAHLASWRELRKKGLRAFDAVVRQVLLKPRVGRILVANPGRMLNLDLQGHVALVSGSTAGIGLAVAEGLAALGAATIVNGRTAARVEAAIAELQERSPSATLMGAPFDLSNAAGVAALIAAFPRVDVLVNNVGVFAPQPFEEILDEEWFRFFETNVMSGVRLSRAYLPYMREKDWGRIIFVSSESALNIPVEMIHYGTTKTAQLAVARGLAESVAGTGITVNSVLPGPTRSEGVAEFVARMAKQQGIDEGQMEREFFKTARPTSLLKRFASTEEVANMIVYLCTPAASATTGASVRVDGGVVKTIA